MLNLYLKIYKLTLHQLDIFIRDEIVSRYVIGSSPVKNFEYEKNIILKEKEVRLPSHIKDKIKRSRRRHFDSLGMNAILKSETYIRTKYVRYENSFLIGVYGSLKIAEKILCFIKSFLKSKLHINIFMDNTQVIDSYHNHIKFLGMVIYNVMSKNLYYKNSREIENEKRIRTKNKILKANKIKKIFKNTRINFIKLIERKKIHFEDIFTPLSGIKYREKIRKVIKILNFESNLHLEKEKFNENKFFMVDDSYRKDLIKIKKNYPIIKIDRVLVYNILRNLGIINSRKQPCCKANITSINDYNIILYFNKVGMGLLNWVSVSI
jgi:hypothetical protein